MAYIDIPYDIYESDKEVVILMPLGGVQKKSLKITIKEYTLYLSAKRVKPTLRDDLIQQEEQCYRGNIKTTIDLPPTVYFKDIHSSLSPENILTIVIPKNIEPKSIDIAIQYD